MAFSPRLGGRWLSLLYCGVSVFPRHEGLRSEEEWGEFVVEYGSISRRDAETQRGLLCVAFSPRLCASAGDGVRYCVVEFLFHRGVGGRDRGRRRGASFPAETLRAFAGSTKNHVRSCKLQFDGVGEKRTRYCCRARKNINVQTHTTTPVSLR